MSYLDGAAGLSKEQPGVVAVETSGDGEVRIEFGGSIAQQADLLERLVKGGQRVISYREEQADLEDVFLKLTTGAVQ